MKCTKTVATRAAPFGPDMYQIVCWLGLRPRPHWGAYSAPPDSVAGLGVGPPGKEKRGRESEGRGRWDWDPSTRDGKGGKGNGGKDGGGRVGKGRGRKRRGGRGNKHTRFKTCGAAHESQVYISSYLLILHAQYSRYFLHIGFSEFDFFA